MKIEAEMQFQLQICQNECNEYRHAFSIVMKKRGGGYMNIIKSEDVGFNI